MATVRQLTIDGVARAKIAHVMSHAEENPYHPGADPVPGDLPSFVCKLDTYRCVFTYTRIRGEMFRHLSVSVPGADYPHPLAVWTIATEFGFTGWDGRSEQIPRGWIVDVDGDDHCVTVAQPRDDDDL